jgi:flavin reductase (DIM6/NTAB) family NADH-FMN oxidoreductase RutF
MEGIAETKEAFGKLATNVAVITVSDRSGSHGCTANAWAEAADPPLLLITLRRGGATHARIEAQGSFAVNVLAADQTSLALGFAGRADRFADVAHEPGPVLGQPLLAGALATFECDLDAVHPFGAYDILVGAVRNAEARATGDPLLYFADRFGALEAESR